MAKPCYGIGPQVCVGREGTLPLGRGAAFKVTCVRKEHFPGGLSLGSGGSEPLCDKVGYCAPTHSGNSGSWFPSNVCCRSSGVGGHALFARSALPTALRE
eukprot:539595-Pleurochrysis_carterae.AAC.2